MRDGAYDYDVEDELDTLLSHHAYGRNKLQDEKYVKVLKSELLKKYGKDTGLQILKDTIEEVSIKERNNPMADLEVLEDGMIVVKNIADG